MTGVQTCALPIWAVAEAASLCTMVILVVLLVRARTNIRWPFVIGRVSIIVLPLLALLLLPRGTFDSDTDLTMDFVQMPYLHHNPDGVDFDGAARLAGYTLSAEELAPGDVLTITFDWSQIDGAHTATVRLVSPAAVRYDVEPLAETSCRLQSAACNSVALRLPDDIPRGVYLLQLRLFGPEGELGARTSGRTRQGTLYLRPVRVPRGPPLPPDASVLARFGPAIRLHTASVAQLAPDRLAVRLDWSAARSIAANYGISLRLIDADGQIREQLDTQPGYGFLPTSLWRPGERFTDRYVLTLPDDLPAGEGYQLEVILYQTPTLKPVGQARLGEFQLPMEGDTPFEAQRPPRTFLLPPLQYSSETGFGGEVRLAGYDLSHEQEPEALRLTLWWQALQTPQTNYTVFVHLFDSATERVAVQSDAQPRDGMYPTSWWVAGEVVSDTVTLPLADVSEGTYRLAVGLYDQAVTRLQAIGPDGRRLVNDRLVLPVDITVENPSP